jgi:transposase
VIERESARLTDLREEVRYRRERLALYKARLYAGRASRQDKLRELQLATDGAAARLRRAEGRDEWPSPDGDQR